MIIISVPLGLHVVYHERLASRLSSTLYKAAAGMLCVAACLKRLSITQSAKTAHTSIRYTAGRLIRRLIYTNTKSYAVSEASENFLCPEKMLA